MVSEHRHLQAIETIAADKPETWASALEAVKSLGLGPSISPDVLGRLARLEDMLDALIRGESRFESLHPKINQVLRLISSEFESEQEPASSTPDPNTIPLQPLLRTRKKRPKNAKAKSEEAEPLKPVAATLPVEKSLIIDTSLLSTFLESHQGEIEQIEGLILELE